MELFSLFMVLPNTSDVLKLNVISESTFVLFRIFFEEKSRIFVFYFSMFFLNCNILVFSLV